MTTWTREFVTEQLKSGRLAYSTLTGWQIGHTIAGEREWFSLIEEHANLVEMVAGELRAAGVDLPSCVQDRWRTGR